MTRKRKGEYVFDDETYYGGHITEENDESVTVGWWSNPHSGIGYENYMIFKSQIEVI